MRSGLRWLFIIFFILLLPVWLLLLVPKLNGFGPELLKQELQEFNAYEQLGTLLHQTEGQPDPGQAEVTDQALVVLRSALTTDYIKSKSNKAIDDTAAWVTRQSDTQPELDLNDIKDQVLTAYPDAQIQIDELRAGLAMAQQELKDNPMPVDGIEGLESDGSASTAEIAKLLQGADSLNNFVDGDFRIKLGQAFTPLYDAYHYYQIAIPVLAIVIALLLIGFVLTNQTWHSRFKNLGWLLLSATVINGILAAIFSVVVLKIGPDMITGMLPNQAEVVGSIGQAVIQSLFTKYVQLELTMTLVLLVTGIIFIIAGIFISKQRNNATSTQPSQSDSHKAQPGSKAKAADSSSAVSNPSIQD